MLFIGKMLFDLLFGDRVSPCSPGWSAIYYVDQTSLEFVAIFCLNSGITDLCPYAQLSQRFVWTSHIPLVRTLPYGLM